MTHRVDAAHRAYVKRLAPELAQTGDFIGWEDIVRYIRDVQGFPDAGDIIEREGLKARLDRLCRTARSRARKANDDHILAKTPPNND